MSGSTVQLLPLGRTLVLPQGAALREALFEFGVEFPCGGRGRCKGCRLRVLAGDLAITADDRQRLSPVELAAGWRLACQARVSGDLTLEIAQWEAAVLGDQSRITFQPRPGLGVAVDLGTTTLAVQLLDLATGNVLAVATAMNAQAVHGADVMSRIHFAVHENGAGRLHDLIRRQIGGLIAGLRQEAARDEAIVEVVLVGNTAMQLLFCGRDVHPLAQAPFESDELDEACFTGAELGWSVTAEAVVRFLPSLGGFVGSDLLAGILATGLAEVKSLSALIDLGTNGEIIVTNGGRVLCASTAAGPAFEGARISMGMRAATGAISEVTVREGSLVCRVLGGGEPRGICGSGLVDAVACGLELGWITSTGRPASGEAVLLAGDVELAPRDIRELQLAKGAITAGLRLMVEQLGFTPGALERVHLAGAFGNYISRANARRIGLLPFPPEQIEPAGNTALLGAKMVLLRTVDFSTFWEELRPRVEHVPLNEDPRFHEVYVEEMGFPSQRLS
ncbi:MAG: DUF4445 domain-containing protein [Verrucomicrobiales bacterium]|nr:DUF4445 domain-containing protein [Verrucomicrobiales bacterium]